MKTLALITIGAAACASHSIQRVSYPDGKPHWEYTLAGGVPNGDGRVWYADGTLQKAGTYLDGEKHGLFHFYDDRGELDHQALFVRGAEVWRSERADEAPPSELLAQVDTARAEIERAGDGNEGIVVSRDPIPGPHFATLDPTGSPSHMGLEVGTGDIQRIGLFASYAGERYGGYAQFLQTAYTGPMSYHGKRTIELGGTRRFVLDRIGTLVTHAGLMFPIGNDDQSGFLASSIGAEVRPDDAAASFPSTVAGRTGVSLVRSGRYYVVQGDLGLDGLFGGEAMPFDALLHANLGAGVGVRAAMASVQWTNAISMSSPSRSLDAIAFAGTVWVLRVWVAATYSHAFSGPEAFTMAVGRDL